MPFRVVLDANVGLAACLDPKMDAKAGLAAEVFRTLQEEEIRPAITESLRVEIETKTYQRVGQLLVAVRSLANRPPTFPLDPNQEPSEVVEQIFASLRRETTGTAAALQILEVRLAPVLENAPIANEASWKDLMSRIALEVTTILAEIQRRKDVLGLDLITGAGKVDQERFRGLVPTPDLEHVAVLAALSEVRKILILFVTMDGVLHGIRDEVGKLAPGLVITNPTFLGRQIARTRRKNLP